MTTLRWTGITIAAVLATACSTSVESNQTSSSGSGAGDTSSSGNTGGGGGGSGPVRFCKDSGGIIHHPPPNAPGSFCTPDQICGLAYGEEYFSCCVPGPQCCKTVTPTSQECVPDGGT